MSAPEGLDPQLQADTMMSVLNDRLAAASPVEVLSEHDDRILEVLEEPDGSRFVRRGFTPAAVRHVGRRGLDFHEAWEGMEDTYAAAGIGMVRSFAFEQEGGEHPFIVVGEYVPDAVDVKDLPVESKVELMQGLGKLLRPEAEFWPSLEGIRADTFKGVKQEDGTYNVVVMDTDPFVVPAPIPGLDRDMTVAKYIEKFSELLWDNWCDEEDRREVAVALVLSLAEALDDEEYTELMSQTGRAFMNLHMMSNNMDPRGTEVDLLG